MNFLLLLSLLLVQQLEFYDVFKLEETITLKPESLFISYPFYECFKVDIHNNMWMIDHVNLHLLKFAPNGKLLKKIGREGRGPAEFKWPVSLDTDKQGNVYVADFTNRRISIFDNDGKFLNSFMTYYCHDVKVDSKGNIYVVGEGVFRPRHGDVISEYIHKFSPKGRYIKSFYRPDLEAMRKLRMGGGVLIDIGEWEGQEYIYAMDVVKNTISILTPSGKRIMSFIYYPPYYKPVTIPKRTLPPKKAYISKWLENLDWTKPIVLIATKNGYFLVHYYNRSRSIKFIEIYDGKGKHIASIKVKTGPLCVDKYNYVYFMEEELVVKKHSFHIPTNISE